MDTENFANAPLSISELRANREQKASLWSPRDALISTLRDLDSGKIKPDQLIVGWRVPPEEGDDDDRSTYSWANATTDLISALGLLHLLADHMLSQSRSEE